MGELRAESVEGNRALNLFPFSNEVKARTLVDELFDKPGRSESVYVQISARDPTLTLVLRRVQSCALPL
jgi:hypothetical protein